MDRFSAKLETSGIHYQRDFTKSNHADSIMIVAHPDDEIVFGGYDILMGNVKKVICMTCGNDKLRADEFKKVMKILQIGYEILHFRDNFGGFSEDISGYLNKYQGSKIITHNRNGEYGHKQHAMINQALRSFNISTFQIGPPLPENVIHDKYELLRIYKSQRHIFSIDYVKSYIRCCRSF